MYVEDVEDVKDTSNTPKGCNAMYVEDVEDGKRTYRHILLITSLIINGFSIRKKFWKAETVSFPTLPSYVCQSMSKIIFDIFNML